MPSSAEGALEESVDSIANWTIMLFIAADGALANFAVESLKQINHSMCSSDSAREAKVVVAAQFAIDAPGGQQIPRYIFDHCSGASIRHSLAGHLNAPEDMTEQQALISFLQWVYQQKRCNAHKYALILWGHGPELLMQPPSAIQLDDPRSQSQGNGNSLYLSPKDLRIALGEGLPKNKPLAILAFDACSMSMFEMAYEVKDFASYMVASQEEVPDLSFPYDTLVELFRRLGQNEEVLLKKGVHAYVSAYQDYVCSAVTGMKRATLSALRLQRCDELKNALKQLANALYFAKGDPGLPALLVEARQCSRDFAAGLYVDLFDFCDRLIRLLSASDPEILTQPVEQGIHDPLNHALAWKRKIKGACEKVIRALTEEAVDISTSALVLANASADSRCHGVSIYFPYLTLLQYDELLQPMVKGGIGTMGGKEFGAVMNNAKPGLLMFARHELIIDTEGYYDTLLLSRDTDWYRFITEQWSRILVEIAPNDLDLRYSAQQCAINLARK